MTGDKKNYNIKNVGKNFCVLGQFLSAAPYGSGHINDTFKVSYDQGGTVNDYIFQRINHFVFKDPLSLMDNISRVTGHTFKKLTEAGTDYISRRTLTVIPTLDGKSCYIDPDGNYWRVYIFIEKAKTYDVIENPKQAYEAAKAFAAFQGLIVDIPGPRLVETIPNFHNTRTRFNTLKQAIEKDEHNRAGEVKEEIAFALERESMAGTLLDLVADGKIPERITHNDTKINNVMMDDETSEGICVIDLDTVMPGLALYDYGDMIRSSTIPTAEDETDLSKVTMRKDLFEAVSKGYMSVAGEFLNKTEIEYLPFAARLMTFEVGIRFLTDHLQGDVYFKIHRKNHNLDRCRTQFKLVQSIEEHTNYMQKFIEGL